MGVFWTWSVFPEVLQKSWHLYMRISHIIEDTAKKRGRSIIVKLAFLKFER